MLKGIFFTFVVETPLFGVDSDVDLFLGEFIFFEAYVPNIKHY